MSYYGLQTTQRSDTMLTILLLSSAYAEAEKACFRAGRDHSRRIGNPEDPKTLRTGFHQHHIGERSPGLHLTEPAHAVVSTQTWVEIGSAHEADNEKDLRTCSST